MRNKIDFSKFHFSSLRLLVSTGERLNKEAWDWYFSKVGNNRCPVINLSGGTEVGGAILSMLPFLDNVPTSVGVLLLRDWMLISSMTEVNLLMTDIS